MTDSFVPRPDRSESSVATSILEKAKLGDQDAFRCMTQLYSGLVYHWCRDKGLPPEDAEDVSQQVFVAVSRHLNRFRRERPEDSFRGWLRIITRSKIADHFRKSEGQEVATGGNEPWNEFVSRDQAEEDSEQDKSRDTAMLYQRAIQFVQGEFSEADCKSFLMLVTDGATAKDVAQTMGVSVNSVYIAKSRILKRLRTEFAELIDDGLE